MARKKKQQYDYDDDYNDLSPADMGEPEVAKVSLEDFVVKEKVSAFQRAYKPCTEDTPGAEAFDDARLREVLKAYVCGLGDPLKLYVEDLKLAGFRMDISIATGEPAIFAVRQAF